MKNLSILFIGLILSFSVSAQDLSLNEILENYYEVTGLEEMAGLKTMMLKGKSVNQGMENNFTMTMMMPGNYRLDIPIQGQNMVQVYSAGEAWMIAPWTGSLDPKDISGDQLKQMEKQADPTGELYNWKEKGNKVELIGKEDFEGSDVYKLKCIDKHEDETVYFIDVENFVILKEESMTTMRGEEIKSVTTLSDYKPVSEMMMPHSYAVSYQGQVVSQILVDEVILNPDVDASLFDRPVTAAVTDDIK